MIHSIYKKASIFLIGVLLITGLYSCKDILDLKPEDSVYDGVYWKTESDATSALMGTYSLLRKSITKGPGDMSHFSYADFTTGVFSDGNGYALNFLVKGDQYYGKGLSVDDFSGDYLDDLQDWTPYYRTITMANTVIEKVSKMPEGAFKIPGNKKRIIGEAYFLRAYTNFYMTRIWGDIPLINKYDPDPVSSTNKPRTNEAIVLDSCAADVKTALKLLTWNTGNDRAVRADKGAAFALLAHINRWKYFVTENKANDPTLLTKAVAAIDSITKSGNYALVNAEDFDQLFKGRSIEGIFEINTSATNNEYQIGSGFYNYVLKTPYIQNRFNGFRMNSEVINAWFSDPSDARYSYDFDTSNKEDIVLTKYGGNNHKNIIYKDPQAKTGLIVDCNISIFRLAEMLLLRAECNELLGNSSAALTDLNAVKSRSHLEDYTGSDLKSEILEETLRELFCEGHTYYDLVRNRALVDYMNDSRFTQDRFDKEGWKWPVARSLFMSNKELTQNNYWIGILK